MDWSKFDIGNWLEGTGPIDWVRNTPTRKKFGIPGTACTVAVNYIKVTPGTNQGADRPMHSHEHEQIMLIMQGDGDVIIEGKRFPMHDGSYCVIPANVMHKYDVSNATKDIINIDIFTPTRDEFIKRKDTDSDSNQ